MAIAIPRSTGPSVEGRVTGEYQGPTGNMGPNTAAQALSEQSKTTAKLGGQMVHIAEVMEEKETNVSAQSSLNSLKESALQQQQAAREIVGANARGSAAELSEKFKQKRDEIASTLTPRARAKFDLQADEIGMQHTDMLARNEYTKNEAHADQTDNAFLELNRQVAVTNGDLPSIVQARAQTLAKIDEVGQRKGWDEKQTHVMKIAETTKLHKDVIATKVDKDPDWAAKYYDSVKDEIDVDERAHIEKSLEVGGLRRGAQDYAKTVDFKKSTYEVEAAKIRKNLDGAKQDAALAEVKSQFAEKEAIKKQGHDSAGDAAYSVYLQTQNYKAIPASVIAAMDPKEAEQLRNYAEKKAEGVKDKTDFAVYHELSHTAFYDTAKFIDPKQTNIAKMYPFLSDADKKYFTTLQGHMRTANDNKTDKGSKVKDLVHFNEQVDTMADNMGWPGGEKGSQRRAEFKTLAMDSIMAYERQNGKSMDDDMRQKTLAGIVSHLTTRDKGFWQFGNTDSPSGDVRMKTVEEIGKIQPSKGEIDAFRSTLPKQLQEQSDESITALYRLRLQNARAKSQLKK